MVVYKITNTANGKSYIGITTTSIEKRWREHRCAANLGNNLPLYRAIRKYGVDAFHVETVDKASSIDELKQKERDLIASLGTYYLGDCGYNMTDGGDGVQFVNRARGESSPSAVLTEQIVRFIRDPELQAVNNADMASKVLDAFGLKFNVDTIKCARNGKNWKHLNEQYPPIKAGKGSRISPMSTERLEAVRDTLARYRQIAHQKALDATKGQRAKHAKMDFDQVRDIYYADESLVKTAQRHGISKKMVLLIRQQKSYTYWTKEFSRA